MICDLICKKGPLLSNICDLIYEKNPLLKYFKKQFCIHIDWLCIYSNCMYTKLFFDMF